MSAFRVVIIILSYNFIIDVYCHAFVSCNTNKSIGQQNREKLAASEVRPVYKCYTRNLFSLRKEAFLRGNVCVVALAKVVDRSPRIN